MCRHDRVETHHNTEQVLAKVYLSKGQREDDHSSITHREKGKWYEPYGQRTACWMSMTYPQVSSTDTQTNKPISSAHEKLRHHEERRMTRHDMCMMCMMCEYMHKHTHGGQHKQHRDSECVISPERASAGPPHEHTNTPHPSRSRHQPTRTK